MSRANVRARTIFDVPGSCLVILSGGLDSTTLLAKLYHDYYCQRIEAVTFDYGQRHGSAEIGSAVLIGDTYNIPVTRVEVPRLFTKSPLIESSGEAVPVGEDYHRPGIAATYVPRRNTVFLALGAAIAEQRGLEAVAYGAHDTDANYPDCTLPFAEAMNDALVKGSDPVHSVRLYAPFIGIDKTAVIRQAAALRVPLGLTHSCYQGFTPACGVCDTCQARIMSFKVAGFIDPIDYAIDIDWGSAVEFPEPRD